MSAALVLLAVVAAYGLIIVTAALTASLVRLRAWGGLVALGVALAVGFVAPGAPGLGRLYGVLAGEALVAGTLAALYRFVILPRQTWRERKGARATARQAALHLTLLIGSAVFLVPFAWLVVTSLKEDEEMSQFPPVWIPRQQVKVMVDGREAGLATTILDGRRVEVAMTGDRDSGDVEAVVQRPPELKGRRIVAPRSAFTKTKQFAPVWKNYPDALKFLPPETRSGLVFLGNTIIICVLTIVGTILSSSLVAYGFARLRWPGRDLLFVVLLATMMLPGAVTMMPVFLIFRWLGWIDTLRPIWAPAFFSSAFNVFLLRQFFLTIPNDLEDAAKIDGCSYFGIYWRIMLPLIKPALAAITIMTFMGSWNNFMGPLIYVSSSSKMPLAYALQLFQTAHGGEPGLLMAASTMMMAPVLVMFFMTQRYFIQGVTLTGIKG